MVVVARAVSSLRIVPQYPRCDACNVTIKFFLLSLVRPIERKIGERGVCRKSREGKHLTGIKGETHFDNMRGRGIMGALLAVLRGLAVLALGLIAVSIIVFIFVVNFSSTNSTFRCEGKIDKEGESRLVHSPLMVL
jgi:hypothetical protein